MKKIILLFIFILSVGSLSLFAQSSLASNANADITMKGSQGGKAPLGSSLTMFLVLGAAYGLTKVYNLKDEKSS